MPASTSTLTTSRSTKDSAATRLRADRDAADSKKTPPLPLPPPPPSLGPKEHDFFWTYTEEPHRTRRQAIIKAHPEVRVLQQEQKQK